MKVRRSKIFSETARQKRISADLCESKVSSSTSTPRHTHTASYGRADCEPAGPELEARIPISVHLLLEIEHKPRHTTTPTQKRNREIKKKGKDLRSATPTPTHPNKYRYCNSDRAIENFKPPSGLCRLPLCVSTDKTPPPAVFSPLSGA